MTTCHCTGEVSTHMLIFTFKNLYWSLTHPTTWSVRNIARTHTHTHPHIKLSAANDRRMSSTLWHQVAGWTAGQRTVYAPAHTAVMLHGVQLSYQHGQLLTADCTRCRAYGHNERIETNFNQDTLIKHPEANLASCHRLQKKRKMSWPSFRQAKHRTYIPQCEVLIEN
jgi:hypothetical protein